MRFLPTTLILLALTTIALAGPLERAETFRPDVYPCKITAAEGAARRVVDALNGSKDFAEDGATLVLVNDALCAEATASMANVFREQFPSARLVLRGSREPGASDAGNLITVRPAAEEQARTVTDSGMKRTRFTGTLTLTVTGGGVDRAFSTRFQDKCWAADFKTFLSQNPKTRYVLGQTREFASSEAEALAEARQAAAKEIWDPLRDELNDRNRGRAGSINVTESFVRRQVESMLKQGKCVEDTFVQRLDGPNGQVWRASILVSLSPTNTDAMVKQVGQAARATVAAQSARRVEQAKGWGSVAAFLAVIVLLYLLVNSLTKGYFVWRLRAASLLLCIVGILVALAVT
jgi:hypothetical protein